MTPISVWFGTVVAIQITRSILHVLRACDASDALMIQSADSRAAFRTACLLHRHSAFANRKLCSCQFSLCVWEWLCETYRVSIDAVVPVTGVGG